MQVLGIDGSERRGKSYNLIQCVVGDGMVLQIRELEGVQRQRGGFDDREEGEITNIGDSWLMQSLQCGEVQHGSISLDDDPIIKATASTILDSSQIYPISVDLWTNISQPITSMTPIWD